VQIGFSFLTIGLLNNLTRFIMVLHYTRRYFRCASEHGVTTYI